MTVPLDCEWPPTSPITINQGSSHFMNVACMGCLGTETCIAVDTHPNNGVMTQGSGFTLGDFTYTPNAGFSGQDSFTLSAYQCTGLEFEDKTYTVNVVATPAPTPSPTPSPSAAPTGPRSFFCKTSNPDSWTNQKSLAQTNGGKLLTVPDQTMQNYIAQQANQNKLAKFNYWIGLNDRTTEGTYTWDDGDSSTYRNWNPGEPNDNWGEDCVETIPGYSWRWNDLGCEHGRRALVQFPWAKYDDIVCKSQSTFDQCLAGPGNTFDHESCSQTAPEFVEKASSADGLSKESIIGGSVVIAVIAMVSLGAVMYLGNKNQWSWFRKRRDTEQDCGLSDENDKDGLSDENDKDIARGKDDTAQGQEEVADIETC